MKKVILSLFMIMGCSVLSAQSNKEDVEIIQSIFGKEKKALVAAFVNLEGTKADAFWKLYDEYETKRKLLGKKRFALLEKYANNYSKFDDVTIDEVVRETQTLQAQTDKLLVQYYGKMKKGVGATPAAQFYHLEDYLLNVVRATILENVPYIGALDDKW